MQARVERIGTSLIPAFQKALAEDDPTRIDFRFQVTDDPKHGDAWSLPSGIILVPRQLVERLPEDSQLAAIIADSIAEVLEKQTLRVIPAVHKMTAVAIAGDTAGIFVPGLGLVTAAGNYKAGRVIQHHSQQQSGRVSLCLLHDAGYDIDQAPMAWLAVSTKSAANPLPKRLPDHSSYLYGYLGTTWHTPPGNSASRLVN
jgi:predicted Zn-dependent protease